MELEKNIIINVLLRNFLQLTDTGANGGIGLIVLVNVELE